MASIAFTFGAADGMQSVSFNVADEDMLRIYDALKVDYMREDDVSEESDYTKQFVMYRLARDLVYNIVSRVNRTEISAALEKLSIEPIRVTE